MPIMSVKRAIVWILAAVGSYTVLSNMWSLAAYGIESSHARVRDPVKNTHSVRPREFSQRWHISPTGAVSLQHQDGRRVIVRGSGCSAPHQAFPPQWVRDSAVRKLTVHFPLPELLRDPQAVVELRARIAAHAVDPSVPIIFAEIERRDFVHAELLPVLEPSVKETST
jgi:hypothetical protein